MENEKRLIDGTLLLKDKTILWDEALGFCDCVLVEDIEKAPTVDAYIEEQVASIIHQADKLKAEERELRKRVAWLKSCLNCKIRKECSRHCGKVVHGCDHWIDGDPLVHGRWLALEEYAEKIGADPTGYMDGWRFCSECEQPMRELYGWAYCPNCGATMDGDGNG